MHFQAQNEKNHFYHLNIISSSKASVHCFVNGFPAFEILSFSSAANTVPIDLYLAGTNTLEVTLDGTTEEITAEGSISQYEKGEMADASDGKPGIAPFKLFGKNKKTEITFTTNGFDFSYLFKNAPIITNEEEVKKYATYLLELLKNKNTKALADEMIPKFKDYAKVYGKPEEKFKTDFETFFNDKFLKRPEDLIVSTEIIIEPLAQKRIYKLHLKDKKGLFVRGGYYFEVYIALIEGKLKIVR